MRKFCVCMRQVSIPTLLYGSLVMTIYLSIIYDAMFPLGTKDDSGRWAFTSPYLHTSSLLVHWGSGVSVIQCSARHLRVARSILNYLTPYCWYTHPIRCVKVNHLNFPPLKNHHLTYPSIHYQQWWHNNHSLKPLTAAFLNEENDKRGSQEGHPKGQVEPNLEAQVLSLVLS